MPSLPGNLQEDAAVQWQLTSARFDDWFKNDLFHFRWWMLLAVFLLSVFIWWKLVDKAKLNELVLFSALVSLMVLVLDELGEELALWDYPTDIVPLFPPISAIDLASLPFLYSLVYQHFKTWKSFIIASAILSAVSCFILEPLFVFTGIYQMITWKSYYGLPLYFAIAVTARAIMRKMFAVESEY